MRPCAAQTVSAALVPPGTTRVLNDEVKPSKNWSCTENVGVESGLQALKALPTPLMVPKVPRATSPISTDRSAIGIVWLAEAERNACKYPAMFPPATATRMLVIRNVLVTPLVAVTIGWILLDERLPAQTVAGGALIVASLALLALRRNGAKQ